MIIDKKRKIVIDILLDSPWYLTLSLKERKELVERISLYLHSSYGSGSSEEQDD
jgi:hypothetical protein